ncbi:MAG TPA: class I SAM-dependent methyltransferase [Gaiellaceae bacterium]|nr:class I SAM-dependent methyltransferase [Gaiellaceae bacterium]
MQSFESFVRERLPEPPARVLEVGCGRGELTTALAVAGHDVLGIDPLAPDGPLFRRLTLDDVENEGRYDAVVAAFSLHHIRDLAAALRKIASLLVPEGLLLVDEFAWDRLDEPTLAWLWGQRQAVAAAAGKPEPVSPAEMRAEWEAEHVGLHGHDALRGSLDEHFERVAFVPTPYLHRLLGGASSAVLEQSLMDAGTIAALGFRYVGRPRRPPGRTA